MELGVCTFGDIGDTASVSPQQRMQNLLEEIKLADKVGLDVFAVGEHHRPDMVVSDPAIVLAAGAAVTKKIRLASGVTVLSSADPVRIHEQFSQVDLLSGGRAEIIAGRGSFIESFALFGYDLEDYDALFAEKLDLLLKLRESEKITWQGRFRSPIDDLGVYPRPAQSKIPVWLGVGGTPASFVRAGTLGLPLTIAIIGGRPDAFVPLVELYRQTLKAHGHPDLPVCINSHGYVAETSEQAAKDYFKPYTGMMNRIGRERGWQPMGWDTFEALRSPEGFMVVGDANEVTEKILYEHSLFKHQRFLMQISVGSMPHDKVMSAIELLGTKVAPKVRAKLA